MSFPSLQYTLVLKRMSSIVSVNSTQLRMRTRMARANEDGTGSQMDMLFPNSKAAQKVVCCCWLARFREGITAPGDIDAVDDPPCMHVSGGANSGEQAAVASCPKRCNRAGCW